MGFLVLRSSVVEVDTGETTVPFKFTPGHYLMFDSGSGGGTAQDKQDLMQDFANETNLVGFYLKERWKNLEGNTQGDYTAGFALIDSYLAALPAGKKFMLQVREQLFGGSIPSDAHGLLPTYHDNLDDGPYLWPGGAAWSGTLIVQAAVDCPETNDAKIALFQAYLQRYEDDDRFEMITTGETSVAVPSSQGFSYSDYTTELLSLISETRDVSLRTPVHISTNYVDTDAHMQQIVDRCVAEQVAIGGPDTMPRDERRFQDNDIYLGLTGSPVTDYRGLVPRVAEVDGTEVGGYLGNFTPAQLWNDVSYGHDSMRPTHWCWYHNLPGRNPDSTAATQWDAMLDWIRGHQLTTENTTNPYGGTSGGPPPDPGGAGPIEIVAVGTVSEANNASVSPAYGATPQASDVGIALGLIRAASAGRTLACSGYSTIDTFGASSQQPMYAFAKTLSAAEGAPTITPSGGASGDVLQAVSLLLRNTASAATILHNQGHKTTTGASSSVPIVTPILEVTEDNCLIVMVVTYQLDCSSFGNYNPLGDGNWTLQRFASTTTGNNQAIAVYSRLQTTATSIPASTVTISGQSTGVVARTMAIALKAA
jgi:hypothetical protein